MRKPKEYKRSYKVLVNIFVVLAFITLSFLLLNLAAKYRLNGDTVRYYVLFCSTAISSVVISQALTILTMTGFHKLSTQDIINTPRKKSIFSGTVLLLTIMMIVINFCLFWLIAF